MYPYGSITSVLHHFKVFLILFRFSSDFRVHYITIFSVLYQVDALLSHLLLILICSLSVNFTKFCILLAYFSYQDLFQ